MRMQVLRAGASAGSHGHDVPSGAHARVSFVETALSFFTAGAPQAPPVAVCGKAWL
jgi:hypothetical protein